MNRLEAPQALKDVYRDLRDRRMLLPALALIIALVAVPMLLKQDETIVPPAPVAPSAEASEISAAVLAEDSVDVRDYRKRLAELKTKNPFKPQLVPTAADDPTDPAAGAGGAETTSGTVPSGTATGGSDSAPAGPVPVPTAPDTEGADPDSGGVVDDTEDTDGGGGNGGGGGGSEPSSDDVEVVNHLVTRRVDVMIGLQGDPKLHENVKPMTILPDAAAPVVAYLGTDEKGKRAAFVVAKDATVVAGDGACVPAPENCLYITLEKNESATLDFGIDGQTYDLRLLEIRDVELKADQ